MDWTGFNVAVNYSQTAKLSFNDVLIARPVRCCDIQSWFWISRWFLFVLRQDLSSYSSTKFSTTAQNSVLYSQNTTVVEIQKIYPTVKFRLGRSWFWTRPRELHWPTTWNETKRTEGRRFPARHWGCFSSRMSQNLKYLFKQVPCEKLLQRKNFLVEDNILWWIWYIDSFK